MPIPYLTQSLFKLTLTNTLPCCYFFSNTCKPAINRVILRFSLQKISPYRSISSYLLCNLTNLFFILFLCSYSFSWYVHHILEFFTVLFLFRLLLLFLSLNLYFFFFGLFSLYIFLHFLHFLFVFLSSSNRLIQISSFQVDFVQTGLILY